MLLSVQELEKQYGDEVLFDKISFTIDEGHKIALVGKNGVGKSTLMKIIAGLETPNSGGVQLSNGRTVAHLPQEIDKEDTRTGIEYIQDGSEVQPHQFFPILNGFGISQEVAEQKLAEMSGGQQTKILLAKFLLTPADVLLFDEPTNNLDIPSLLWLEKFLAESKKAMIIISHDIVFLNTVANRVFELKDCTLTIERGTYGDYLDRRQKEFEKQMKEYKAQREEVARIEKNIQTLQQKGEQIDATTVQDSNKMAAGRRRDQASSGQGQVTTLKKRLEKMKAAEKPFEEEAFTLHIEPRNIDGDLEIDLDSVIAGYTNGVQVGPLSLHLKLGDRICFMGENGAGKSTLLKTIIGLLEPVEGIVKRAEGISIGDFMQHHERVEGEMSALEFFMKETKSDKEKAMHMLKRAGLQEETINQRVDGLSSGTRARLLFSIFVVLGVNVLVLDEPTNHLDIEGVTALKEMLKEYTGMVLLVSHNRWFLDELEIGSFYRIEDGAVNQIKEFDQYVNEVRKRAERMVAQFKRMSLGY